LIHIIARAIQVVSLLDSQHLSCKCFCSLKEDDMLFITQGRFTQNAMKGMLAKPEDREEEVRKLFAKSGGKLLAYYFTFGECDFLIVSEGPSVQDGAVAAIVAAAGGGVSDVKTTMAMTSAEMKNAFAKAGPIAASFRSAGH
jgi:uncharacterized protein with GYD domain